MENTYEEESKKLVSDFNEAKFQILRLHNIWLSCHRFSTSGQLVKWKWELDAAWRELRKDAKDLDDEREGNKNTKDEDLFYKRIEAINEKIGKEIDNSKRYQLLDEKESILRELQDASGKGSKKRAKDEDLMD